MDIRELSDETERREAVPILRQLWSDADPGDILEWTADDDYYLFHDRILRLHKSSQIVRVSRVSHSHDPSDSLVIICLFRNRENHRRCSTLLGERT